MTYSIILFSLSIIFYTLSQLQQQGKLWKWSKDHVYGFFGTNSWERKYKLTWLPYFRSDNSASRYVMEQYTGKSQYYRLFNIPWVEAFPGSATIFVSMTDGYHMFQSLFFKSLITSISLLTPNFWLTFAILWCIQVVVMNVLFKIIK